MGKGSVKCIVKLTWHTLHFWILGDGKWFEEWFGKKFWERFGERLGKWFGKKFREWFREWVWSGGSEGGAPFSISCSFSENLAKSYVGAPPQKGWYPSYGESWIRPWFGEWIGEWFGKSSGRQRFGEKLEQMHCKTSIQYISGYDRSIQIYDMMAISFATDSIKTRKMITVKQDATHYTFLTTKKCKQKQSIIETVFDKNQSSYMMENPGVSLEFFLNVFTEFAEFSDKNICHYSKRAQNCHLVC